MLYKQAHTHASDVDPLIRQQQKTKNSKSNRLNSVAADKKYEALEAVSSS